MIEVGLRDGLQNEAVHLGTADKIALAERLIAAGVRRMEVASFVNPRRVPQMADAEAVVAGLPRHDDVTYIGLVLNERGASRALDTAIDELGCVCVATDRFAMANQGQTSDETVEIAARVADMAARAGRGVQLTIGASFGCPFEGEVPVERVVEIARRAAATGIRELALADTIGAAAPADVVAKLRAVRAVVGDLPLRVHFHNTRGTGLANVWAALGEGVAVIDASIGGLGGCPFAPKAAGNVATEDVLYMLERSGIDTGLDMEGLIDASRWLEARMDKPLPSMLPRAGTFPGIAAATDEDMK